MSLKFKYLKLAFESLDNVWDFTLNTDEGYESVRSREKILKRHYIHNAIGSHRPSPEFYEALDAYLSLRKLVDEIESFPGENIAVHISKSEPSFTIEEKP